MRKCPHEYQTMCRWDRKDGRSFAAYQCDDCGQMLDADGGEWKDINTFPPADKELYKRNLQRITEGLFT